MKKYAVLQKIGNFNATVVREFDDVKTATTFMTILVASEEHARTTYYVVEILN